MRSARAPGEVWRGPACLDGRQDGTRRGGRFSYSSAFTHRMATSRLKVLLIEDDPDSRDILAEILEPDFEVITAADGLAGLAAFERESPQVVLTDESLPGMSGSALAREMKQRNPGVRVVLVSGFANLEGAAVADAVLRKPVDIDQLSQLLAGGIAEAPAHH
jgi:CheY-like chemotaxis protein